LLPEHYGVSAKETIELAGIRNPWLADDDEYPVSLGANA